MSRAGSRNGHSHDDLDALAHGRGKRVADPELVRLLHDRITNIEKETAEERRDATKQRHDFRAEMNLALHGVRDEMRTGFTSITTAVSNLSDKVHRGETKTMDWRLKLAGWLLAALLGVVAYLLINGSPWAR